MVEEVISTDISYETRTEIETGDASVFGKNLTISNKYGLFLVGKGRSIVTYKVSSLEASFTASGSDSDCIANTLLFDEDVCSIILSPSEENAYVQLRTKAVVVTMTDILYEVV